MRSRLILAGAALLVAGAVSAAVVILTSDSSAAPETTTAGYLARVNAICRSYNHRLSRYPPPVAVNPQVMARAIRPALPLVAEELARVRSIQPPDALTKRVRSMLALSGKALRELRLAYRESRAGKVEGVAALGHFLGYSHRARELALAIGLSC